MKEVHSIKVLAPFVCESCTKGGDWKPTDVLTASRIKGKREKVMVEEFADFYGFAVMDDGGIRETFRKVPKRNVQISCYREKPAPMLSKSACNEHQAVDCLWCCG